MATPAEGDAEGFPRRRASARTWVPGRGLFEAIEALRELGYATIEVQPPSLTERLASRSAERDSRAIRSYDLAALAPDRGPHRWIYGTDDALTMRRQSLSQPTHCSTMRRRRYARGAILELRNPPDFEGAGFVIEGLTFDRAVRRSGVGIRVAANHVPKGTTFRSVKVFGQDVGFHINYAWQFYFSDCIVRHNRIGLCLAPER